eukprot:8112189-Lingulodinium_polyedra.AAC.1
MPRCAMPCHSAAFLVIARRATTWHSTERRAVGLPKGAMARRGVARGAGRNRIAQRSQNTALRCAAP